MITYLVGDATNPGPSTGPRIIAHITNNRGGWGRGFVNAISARWRTPEYSFRNKSKAGLHQLGDLDLVLVEPALYVASMCAQHGYQSFQNPHPLDLVALTKATASLNTACLDLGIDVTIHMPRIGCGLAGGVWSEIEPIVATVQAPVYVYDLPKEFS